MCSIKQINRPLPPSQKTLLRPQLLPPQAGRSSSASPSADPATRILLSEESSRPVETRFSIAPPLARDKKTIADPAQAAEKRLPCPPDLVAIVSSHETATAAVSIRSRTANLPPATNVPSHRPFRTHPQPITFFINSSAIFIESPITLIINTPEPNTLDGFRRTSDGPAPIGPQPPGSPFVGLIGTTQGHP